MEEITERKSMIDSKVEQIKVEEEQVIKLTAMEQQSAQPKIEALCEMYNLTLQQ